VEVDLCGHATLASAHVLWETGQLQPTQQARFFTRSGLLTAQRRSEWIEMDFPATEEQKADPPPRLLDALGVTPGYAGKNRFDYLVEVEDEVSVRVMRPNYATLSHVGARAIIVTSRSASPPYDFVSRFFAPGSGIDEDPVTGSAHCCLGPFWK